MLIQLVLKIIWFLVHTITHSHLPNNIYSILRSAQTLYAYLKTIKPEATEWIDARDILIVESDSAGLGEKGSTSTTGVTPLWEQTKANMDVWWQNHSFGDDDESAPILVVTGFVAKTASGVPTTLKRSGSDYSATIFAKLLAADRVTMWKNTVCFC